ncbi:uncharacterized protein LOC121923788 [Sceloporus undulatus]|uniref:uncharacterized protein LOC121923788 n=1 Tax=Sceloporus undulatus TaxID=8520 RepID=UPI001C4BF0CA|nr:uncharacterized protein LOC121923788 [Sceloporus undulatus]
MPKRKSILSLERQCMENVARNMESMWVKDYRIHQLAGSLIQKLLQSLREKKLLSSSMLGSLLLPEVTEVNLTDCPHLMNSDIAQVITKCCKNLTSLILCNCNQLLPGTLAELLKGLPHLIKLDLSKTQCDAHVLSVAGTCLRKLCQLDISNCPGLFSQSLFHLAYNPISRSFGGQALETIVLGPLKSRIALINLIQDLAFLLIALPKLKFLVHGFLIEAVISIHEGQFERIWKPSRFPSLEEVARHRMSSHPNEEWPRLTLALKEIHDVMDSSLPVVCAVCPHLSEITVMLGEGPDIDQHFSSACHITKLTLYCRKKRDMKDLLPVMERLRPQLESLSINGFCFEDGSSFQALLNHCVNLRNLSINLRTPCGKQPNIEGPGWDSDLLPREFPRISNITLVLYDIWNPMPSSHIIFLEQCLESLLKHSPCLEDLELAYLPFSLDEVFQKVLDPPGAALLALRKLSLIEVQMSIGTIHQLLSSENQLEHISMNSVSSISEPNCQELLQRVYEEGLDLNILWTLKS